MIKKIAIIGGGNLGCAIAEGLIKSKYCNAEDITLTKRNIETLHELMAKGATVTTDNAEAVRNSELIIVAVKPYQIGGIIDSFKRELTPQKILISAATGVLLAEIEDCIQQKMPIFRAMPNTAIAIRQSMTCLSYNAEAMDKLSIVKDLFSALGRVAVIEEQLMDAATVLGACGTAFAMRFIRANIQGGIEIGFDVATANLIVAQTVMGAADLLLQKGTHPEDEIDKVTTPKGCTIAGLNEMEHQGFSSSLIKGIAVSYGKIAK